MLKRGSVLWNNNINLAVNINNISSSATLTSGGGSNNKSERRLGLCSQIATGGRQHSSPIVFPEKRSKKSKASSRHVDDTTIVKVNTDEPRVDIGVGEGIVGGGDKKSDLMGFVFFSGKLALDKKNTISHGKDDQYQNSADIFSQEAVETKLTSTALIWGSHMVHLDDVISVSYDIGVKHFTVHSYPLKRCSCGLSCFVKPKRTRKDYHFLASSVEEALQWVGGFADQHCYVNCLPYPLVSSKKQASSELLPTDTPPEFLFRCKTPPKMLVILNPRSGHGSSSQVFHEIVEPIFKFFASGSLDTNLKIWDIRKKGCIHTYKGHTRGVNAIRFTPDGRWIVSGGEDNTVKLWDLTAGKLLHDFKYHEGQIHCIDFHPHEFLLATGSADRTVKFWDLETFELIGSSGPETSGVRSLTFNPDGRTLLCGLHESLKVVSWEPIICHDGVDVGWSRLSDLNVHEGKLLGCSYNQSCVGVWVVDISRIEPYAVGTVKESNGNSDSKSGGSGNSSVLLENNMKTSLGRLSVSQNSDTLSKETKSIARLSVSQNSDPIKELAKESKILTSTGTVPGTPQKVNLNTGLKTNVAAPTSVPNAAAPKENSSKAQSAVTIPVFNKADCIPVIVPRTNTRFEQAAESRKEVGGGRQFLLQPNSTDFRKFQNMRDDDEQSSISLSGSTIRKATEMSGAADRNVLPVVKGSVPRITTAERNIMDDKSLGSERIESNLVPEPSTNFQEEIYDTRGHRVNRETRSLESQRGGRMRTLAVNWDRRGRSSNYEGYPSSISPGPPSIDNVLPLNVSKQRGRSPSTEKEMAGLSNEDVIVDILREHDQFTSSMQSRLTKLQVVLRYWERNDVKGAICSMEKMADHAVLADVVSIVAEKTDIVTLDLCICLLPLLSCLLGSDIDRHLSICLDMLLKLVRIYGSMIYSAVSASAPVGVDIEAEQRLERYNLCYVELEKIKRCFYIRW